MSCRPTDGPLLKSILDLYCASPDCLLFISLAVQQSITFHPQQSVFFLFFTPAVSPPSPPPSPLQCQSIWLSCALSPSHSLPPLSLIFGPIQPSFFFSLESHGVFAQVAPSALTLCVFYFLCLSVFSYSLSWCFSFRQLMENKISTIERGAFQDLKELERL